MKKINRKLTIIKYGSDTLVNKNVNGEISIDNDNINKHGAIINNIKNPVIIVSSGAVAFGKTLHHGLDYVKDEVIKKRIFSSIGNPHLSVSWNNAIPNKILLQSLLTHRDLTNEDSRKEIIKILHTLYKKNGAIVQVNDNDFITGEELTNLRGGDFGDNDKITTLLADICSEIFDKVEVIINTSADGVLENNKILSKIKTDTLTDDYIEKICDLGKSSLGTGGMANKLKILRDMLQQNSNITAYIINGKKSEALQSTLQGNTTGSEITSREK